MNGRELTVDQCVKSLSRKGVIIEKVSQGITQLDITYARRLGNGSWGMIDFLTGQYRMFLCGLDDYAQKQGKKGGK